MSPAIVPATAMHWEQFYGAPPPRSFRGLVAVHDGVPLAIGGTYVQGDCKVAFAAVKPEMRERFRKTGVRLAREVMAMIRASGVPVLAVADPQIEAAPRFLEHLGFHPVHEGVHAWRP